MAESTKDFLKIPNENQGADGTYRTVTDGTGISTGLKLNTTNHVGANYSFVGGAETVDGGASGAAVALKDTMVSFIDTDTDKTHVTLADGVAGQIKIIFHKSVANTASLVVTPANFAAGAIMTSANASRGVMLIFDGTNWQVMGEITGAAEFVIS